MKSTLLAAVVAICICGRANAQLPKVLIAAHAIYSTPTSTDFKNTYKYGYGGDVEAGIGFGKTIISAIGSYTSYQGENSVPNLGATAFKLGLRRYLVAGLFLNANAGSVTLKNKGIDGTTSKFVVEGGAGIKLLSFELVANYGGFNMPSTNGSSFAGAFHIKAGFAIKI